MYVIHNGLTYIKLGNNGTPMSCSYSDRDSWDWNKANNILKSLPRTLKQFNFVVEEEPDDFTEISADNKIENENRFLDVEYTMPENVNVWLAKFNDCKTCVNDAVARVTELKKELANLDDQTQDVMHIIELGKVKDMYGGWKAYKTLKEIREKRREVKDEIYVLENILNGVKSDCFDNLDIEHLTETLSHRRYRLRTATNERNELYENLWAV